MREWMDIVPQLRAVWTGNDSRMNLMHYCDKAADEIERLRALAGDTREYTPNGRNVLYAAARLAIAPDDELRLISRRDPDMFRDVAKELLRREHEHQRALDAQVVPGKQIAEV